jgi:glycosyltransferase involved in cell wall biosynthesis
VDTEYFRPLERTSDGKSRTNTIIVVGSHKPQKNFHRFVNAIKILRDEGINLRIKWYGIFPEHIDSHKAYVESLNLNSVIYIYGPSQDIRSVYQSADFLCLPSIFEGFPNALCEAMSCGLPIACSDVCDNPYIVRAGLNGFLFDPYKPAEIAKAIISLTNLTIEERQKISQINRRCAEENFSLELFIKRYVEIIG